MVTLNMSAGAVFTLGVVTGLVLSFAIIVVAALIANKKSR